MSRDLLARNYYCRHLAWRLMRCIARDLPSGGVLLVARGVADLLWFIDAPGRRIVDDNLSPLVPDRDARKRAVRHCYRACAEQLAYTLRLDRRPLRDPTHITVIDPWHVFGTRPLTGPVIIAVSHMDWDVALTVLHRQSLVRDLAVVALPSGDAWVDRELAELRACCGAQTLPWASAARASLAHLRAGKTLGVLADRNYSGGGNSSLTVFTNGRPRQVPRGPAELARRSGARIIPMAVIHGTLVVGAAFTPQSTADVDLATQAIAHFHLRAVATAPGRWVAFHSIWNSEECL